VKTISGKKFCKILEQNGWELERIKGSHHIYSHTDCDAILTVPIHGNKDMKKGTLKKLLKDASMDEDEL